MRTPSQIRMQWQPILDWQKKTAIDFEYLKAELDADLNKKWLEASNKIYEVLIERYRPMKEFLSTDGLSWKQECDIENYKIYNKLYKRKAEPMREFLSTDFEVMTWSEQREDLYTIYAEDGPEDGYFLWKDGTIHLNSTGYAEAGEVFEDSLGYFATEEEAERVLLAYKCDNGEGLTAEEIEKIFGIELYTDDCDLDKIIIKTNGNTFYFESETVQEVKPEPKYIPQVGHVVRFICTDELRIIVANTESNIFSAYDFNGHCCDYDISDEAAKYEYVGKMKDLI